MIACGFVLPTCWILGCDFYSLGAVWHLCLLCGTLSQALADTKFSYDEEACPEDFFVPYAWALAVSQTPDLQWNPSSIALFSLSEAVCDRTCRGPQNARSDPTVCWCGPVPCVGILCRPFSLSLPTSLFPLLLCAVRSKFCVTAGVVPDSPFYLAWSVLAQTNFHSSVATWQIPVHARTHTHPPACALCLHSCPRLHPPTHQDVLSPESEAGAGDEGAEESKTGPPATTARSPSPAATDRSSVSPTAVAGGGGGGGQTAVPKSSGKPEPALASGDKQTVRNTAVPLGVPLFLGSSQAHCFQPMCADLDLFRSLSLFAFTMC